MRKLKQERGIVPVCVTQLVTGQARTENWVIGPELASLGSYIRQAVAWQLILMVNFNGLRITTETNLRHAYEGVSRLV